MLEPFFDASLPIQIHLISAIESIIIGPFVLLRSRRDKWHKALGYIWVTNMFLAAASSLFIHENPMFGPFSPIHLLSVLTLWGLVETVRHAKNRNIVAHKQTVKTLYVAALGGAGVLAFLPGRILNVTFFRDAEVQAFIAILCFSAIAYGVLRLILRDRPMRVVGNRP